MAYFGLQRHRVDVVCVQALPDCLGLLGEAADVVDEDMGRCDGPMLIELPDVKVVHRVRASGLRSD